MRGLVLGVSVGVLLGCSGDPNGGGSVDPGQASLAISVTGQGTVRTDGMECRGSCTKGFAKGTQVVLHATPESGTTFSGWGGACSGTGDCTLTLDDDKSVTAAFAVPPPP